MEDSGVRVRSSGMGVSWPLPIAVPSACAHTAPLRHVPQQLDFGGGQDGLSEMPPRAQLRI